MENNSNFEKQIDEILRNKSLSSDDGFIYQFACSSFYAPLVLRILIFLCQKPIKEVVLKAITEQKNKQISPEEIPELQEHYYHTFIDSIQLPFDNLVANESGSDISDSKISDANLEIAGLYPFVKLAIEHEIPNAAHKRLALTLFGIWLHLDQAPDNILHCAYLAMVMRLEETNLPLEQGAFESIVSKEGYRLDEIDALDYFRIFLCSNEAALIKFFGIKGTVLPGLSIQMLKIIGGQGDDSN